MHTERRHAWPYRGDPLVQLDVAEALPTIAVRQHVIPSAIARLRQYVPDHRTERDR
jgi:hypothetical protein